MDSNRVRLTWIDEITLGTTPTTPRMRRARFTSEGLKFKPVFVNSEEIRDDRMNSDPIKVDETHQGPINGELSYPVADSPLSSWIKSMMFNDWANTPSRDNDGVADSVITDIGTVANTITCTTGPAFVIGHLVRTTGFATAANNTLARVTTGGTTSLVATAGGYVGEAAPPAAARVKVVGLEGAAGDIVAAADGLTSTALNFTTLGLVVGQWIKIGGTGAAFRFATATCNGWARIIAIAAGKLTLDNLPTGWATDAGAAKTIRVFFGDQIKNGVTTYGGTVERGFLGQTVPTYIAETGMVANQGSFEFPSKDKAKFAFTFMGLTGTASTVSLDSLPETETQNAVMSTAINVGRIAENGAVIGGPNFIKSMSIAVNNNMRTIDAIRDDEKFGAVALGSGSCDVTVTLETYFGSDALLAKLFAGSATNLNARIAKDGQAIVYGIPRVTFSDGESPSAGGKNQDVMLPLTAMASKDALTSAHLIIDRLEFFQA